MRENSVAVIVNGCMREITDKTEKLINFTDYKRVLENVNRLLSDFKTVHIYFHTWNPFVNTDISLNIYSYDKDLLIKELSTIPNIHKLIFEDQFTSDELDSKNAKYTQFLVKHMQCKSNRTSMYNCFKAYNTLCHEVKMSGINYDYILRTRNDLIFEFNDFNTLVSKAEEDYLCIPPNTWCPLDPQFINDHWVFAKTDYLMKGLCYSSLEEFNEVVAQSWNQEQLTYKHLLKANRPIFTAGVSSYHILHHNRKFV
jgi:hypothetical protein